MSDDDFQKPGDMIKPIIPDEEIPKLVKSLYGLEVMTWKELNSYDDRNYHVIVKDRYDSPHIKDVCTDGYVLKVLNTLQSKDSMFVDAQVAATNHLKGKTVAVPEMVKNIKGELWSYEKIHMQTRKDDDDGSVPFGIYIVRLMQYIPGTLAAEIPYLPRMLYNVGKFVGGLQNALKGFSHPYFDNQTLLWNMLEVPKLSDFLHAVQEKSDQNLVKEVLDGYNKDIVQNLQFLDKSIVHGDLNEQNILMTCTTEHDENVYNVCGVLDFADMNKAYAIIDIAISIAYFSLEAEIVNQLDVGGYVLAGVQSVYELTKTEMDMLRTLVCCRLCQSLVMGAYSFQVDPSNVYLLVTAKKGWPLLKLIWNTPNDELLRRWKDIINNYNI